MAKRNSHVIDLPFEISPYDLQHELFDRHLHEPASEVDDAAILRAKKNSPPVAKNDVNGKDRVIADRGTSEGDATAKGNVLANDTDKNRDTLKVQKPDTIEGDFGTLKLAANGKWTYTVDDDNPDVAGLETGQRLFDTFKYTVTDGRGGKDTAVLKIKIEGNEAAGPEASITLDTVTSDNIVNSSEASGTVNITGTVGGDVKDGDTVTLTVNGIDYHGLVSSGHFSIAVSGTQLSVDSDSKIEASVTTGESGNTTTATASKNYGVDMTAPTATISVSSVTADGVVNIAESGGSVTISGTVGGDVKAGDIVTLTVNGQEYTGAVAAGKFSIGVLGSDLVADGDKVIDASVTAADGAGNTFTADGSRSYTVDTTPPVGTVGINTIAFNDVVDRVESDDTVNITGTTR